ncbi:MAG: hypothetical protein IPL98_07630 [Saprospiraceae bacterium]|nr:hypothetical protein [Saprospiraceae bacterium]
MQLIAFILYFTGLFNLMFNSGHYMHLAQSHSFVKYISYAVSTTGVVYFRKDHLAMEIICK